MIVTVDGKFEKIDSYTFQISSKFPTIYLDKFDYNISVRSISVESVGGFHNCRLSLRTTAVDKTALNPDQEILSFVPVRAHAVYSPRKPIKYKIQLKEVHTADFYLSSTKTVDLLEIDTCHIIFEITRDVRIQ